MYIKPEVGKTAVFTSSYKKEDYHVVMSDVICTAEVTVVDRQALLDDISLVKFTYPDKKDSFIVEVGESNEMYVNFLSGAELEYSVEDPTIAEITDIKHFNEADWITIKLLKEGETALKVVNSAGNSTLCPITSLYYDPDFRFISRELTGISGSVVGFDFSYGNYSLDDIQFKVADEAVFELAPERTTLVYGVMLGGRYKNGGSTVLTATAPDGKTASVNIYIAPPINS